MLAEKGKTSVRLLRTLDSLTASVRLHVHRSPSVPDVSPLEGIMAEGSVTHASMWLVVVYRRPTTPPGHYCHTQRTSNTNKETQTESNQFRQNREGNEAFHIFLCHFRGRGL